MVYRQGQYSFDAVFIARFNHHRKSNKTDPVLLDWSKRNLEFCQVFREIICNFGSREIEKPLYVMSVMKMSAVTVTK